jgi:hypothetical protein
MPYAVAVLAGSRRYKATRVRSNEVSPKLLALLLRALCVRSLRPLIGAHLSITRDGNAPVLRMCVAL